MLVRRQRGCSRTFGVGTLGKHVMGVVIPRSARAPMEKKTTLVTICDNQRTITFPIYEGESKTTLNNNYLGEFKLHDIPPAPKDVPKFDVCFEIDANGVLAVSA